jgi:hypothetical protein
MWILWIFATGIFVMVFFSESGLIATIVTLILLAIIVAAMLKIDWELVFEKYVKKP